MAKRPLELAYQFVFIDAIHYKVKENDHQYITKVAYVVMGSAWMEEMIF